MKRSSQFRTRLFILAGILGAWLLLIPCRILFFIGPGRTATILKGEELARKSGLIPAMRGRIITQDGHVLAWNERYFDLKATGFIRKQTGIFLTAVLSGKFNPDEETIYRNLSSEEFSQLRKALRRYPELKIVPRVERLRIADARLHSVIGECSWQNNRLTGISGLEKQYDNSLAGTSGEYEVMVDRYRNWIMKSLRFIRKPRKGQDLYLNQTLTELLHSGGKP